MTCTFWQPSFFYDSWIIYNFVAIVLSKIAILAFTYLYTLSRCSANDEMLMFYFHQNRCVEVNWDVFKLYADVWMLHNINAMYRRYDSCKNSHDWLAICFRGGHFHDQSFCFLQDTRLCPWIGEQPAPSTGSNSNYRTSLPVISIARLICMVITILLQFSGISWRCKQIVSNALINLVIMFFAGCDFP